MLDDAPLMFIAVLSIMFAVYLYVGFTIGFTIKAFKKQWEHSEGRSNMILSILKIPAAVVLLGVILVSINTGEASEIRWFEGGSVFAGIDYNVQSNPFCRKDGINDNLSSNMGATQNIISYRSVNMGAKYTHHSCVLNPDAPVNYDAIGIYAEWTW